MKRHFLLIPCALLPYFAILTLIFFFRTIEIPLVICGAVFLLLLLLSLPASIIYAACCAKEKSSARELAKVNLIIKLIHIPAYVAIFIIGFICFITVALFMFAALLSLFDLYIIVQTGIVGAVAAKQTCVEGKMSTAASVICSIAQFIYFVDVVAAIVLLVKQREKKAEELLRF